MALITSTVIAAVASEAFAEIEQRVEEGRASDRRPTWAGSDHRGLPVDAAKEMIDAGRD